MKFGALTAALLPESQMLPFSNKLTVIVLKLALPFNIIMENPAKDKKTPRRRNRPGFFLRFHQLLSGSKQIKCFIRL